MESGRNLNSSKLLWLSSLHARMKKTKLKLKALENNISPIIILLIRGFQDFAASHTGFLFWRKPTCSSFQKTIESSRPSSPVAIPAIAWATSLNRTTVARAIAAAIATALRSGAAAIANRYVMRNFDQSMARRRFGFPRLVSISPC